MPGPATGWIAKGSLTLRIGLVIYGSLGTISGGYLYDRKLVDHLRRRGDEVTTIELPWRSYAHHLRDNWSATLERDLRSDRWDILLQDELNHPSLFRLNRRIGRVTQSPMVSIVHHLRSSETRPGWQNSFYRRIEKRYLESVDAYIFNSQTTRAAVMRVAPIAGSRPSTVVFPAGDQLGGAIETTEILQRSTEPGPLRVVFVGNLIRRKGLLTLLEALEKLPENCCTLKIIGGEGGEPEYSQQVRRRIKKPGFERRAALCGRLADAELAALLHESHVLCVPSSYEGFGIVYLEGMACGLPAIAGAEGAAREIITPGRDGFLVKTGDVAALAQHLADLAKDRERLAAMGLAARQRFLAHPTWEESAAQIRQFLSELIGNRKSTIA